MFLLTQKIVIPEIIKFPEE